MKAIRVTAALCAAVLAAVCILSCLPIHGEEEIYRSVLRLHVLAVSDEPEEQSRKLRVRDAVLDALREPMADAVSLSDALERARGALPAVREAAQREAGDVPVTVTLGRETYPTRVYGSYALPAGEYASLRVTLGEGEGRNWWCVLFPQLCTARAEDDGEEAFLAAGFTPEQVRVIRKGGGTKYKIRFRLLEILSETFGFSY